VNGAPGAAVQVPAGYVAEDLNGNPLLDANGNPVTSFNLNSQGQAIVEVKTGGATLTSNQSVVYPAVQSGSAAGTGAGTNAAEAGMSGPLPQTPVIVLRKQ
jgi:filamentous hemagglutinin